MKTQNHKIKIDKKEFVWEKVRILITELLIWL